MTEYKHALLLFTKPPIPGSVKTRLTKERGGPFTEARAAQLFECSVLDVMELCTWALADLEAQDAATLVVNPDAPRHSYDIFVSTAPESDLALMKETFEKVGEWPREFHYICDHGSSFDEHFDDAFRQIFDLGYDTIVSVGGDIPMMPREHIPTAFRWLQYFLIESENGGMVEAPCQECGVSLVGWTKDTPMDHQGVYYAMSGRPALDAYIEKAGEHNLPFAHLSPVADIDDIEDLAHAISLMKAAEYASQHLQPNIYVPRRCVAWVKAMNLRVSTPPNNDFDSREKLDDPNQPVEEAAAAAAIVEPGDPIGTPGPASSAE